MPQASGEPLTKCPICRYDLTGLPANHRCPECAFEYDETTRVWVGNRHRSRWLMPIVLLWLPPTALIMVLAYASRATGLTMVYPDNFFRVLAFQAALTALALIPVMRPGPIVLVDQHGIAFGSRKRLKRFCWHEIWLAAPGTKIYVPPWVASQAQLAALAPARRWWTVFTRGGFRIGAPSHVYLVGKEQWKHARYVDFLAFGLSGAKRRVLMAEIYRRWHEHNAGGVCSIE